MNRPPSLQRHLTALVLGTVLAVWVSAAAFTWLDASHELDELLDGHLAQAAALLVVQQASGLGGAEHEAPEAPQLHRYAPRVAFQLWHDGVLETRSANAPRTPMWPGAAARMTGFQTVQIDGQPWRVFTTPGAESDEQVFVAERLDSRASILSALLRSLLLPLVLALPLLALAVGWAVRRGMSPLRRLSGTLAERQPQALQPVSVDPLPAEMVTMVQALNGLLRRIAEMIDFERRFTADAAHELRTPIAAIHAQAQVALAADDDAVRHHALEATVQGCNRAAHLVEQLLTLSRLESTAAVTTDPVGLAALTRRVVGEQAPAALARRQELSLDAQGECILHADEALLSVLLRNLVDNAVRYSPAGAAIRVTLKSTAQTVSLQVEDAGAGMAPADAARLGERFFRVLGSGQSGSGLGWSIVRRIAAATGAQLSVARSAALGGLSVEVTWPA